MTNLSLLFVGVILSVMIIGSSVVYRKFYAPTSYVYFVSYSYKYGSGNASIEMSVPITHMSHAELIARELEKTPEIRGVVVLNYILLRIVRGKNDNAND